MKLNKDIPFLKERMAPIGGEFDYLNNKYENIAFNTHDWNQNPNSGKYLWATEPNVTYPKNFDVDYLSKNYKGLITCNSKFKEMNEDKIEIYVTNGVGNYNDWWIIEKEEHVPFQKKIHGICTLQNIYYSSSPGAIIHLRQKWVEEINIDNFANHVFAKSPWGGEAYMGHPEKFPSAPKNLQTTMKYKFRFCAESVHHPLWSYDWITERILDCLKCKTIPIYIGCFNIEDKLPPELYIDLTKFNNINDAIKSILDISEEEYERRTTLGLQFYNDCKIGNISDIEKVLKDLN